MIDNAEKRRSVAGIPHVPFWGNTPNASKDSEWRQQAAWGYSGIAMDVPQLDVTSTDELQKPVDFQIAEIGGIDVHPSLHVVRSE